MVLKASKGISKFLLCICRKVCMFIVNKFLLTTFVLFNISCSSITSKVERRSPSSSRDCLSGIESIFELANDNFLKYLNKSEIDKIKKEYKSMTSVLDDKGILYRFVKLYNDDEHHFAIEISEEGKHPLAKYLRRIKPINSNMKFYFSNTLSEEGESAAYFSNLERIVLGEDMLKFIENDISEEYITILSHEMRHAQLHKHLLETGENSYSGVFLRVGGISRSDDYDDVLTLDESYTYMKDAKAIFAQIKKKKRLGQSTKTLDETLRYNIYIGKKLSNQILKNLNLFLSQTPEIVVDSSDNGKFLSYSYLTENREKEFLFSIKPVKKNKIDLTIEEERNLVVNGPSVIQKQIDYVESNLEKILKLEKEIN